MSNAHLLSSRVYFGGPDLKNNALRDRLLQSIRDSSPNSTINWMCYYLNEPKIFNALLEAAGRGVKITILLERNPRTAAVNQFAIERLRKQSDNRITVIAARKKPLWEWVGIRWQPHLHGKLYYFSHPAPHIYIGSYNPTGGTEDLPIDIIGEIGDHSISHNVLVKLESENAIRALNSYFMYMSSRVYRSTARIRPSHNRTLFIDNLQFNFLPTMRTHPAHTLLTKIDPGAKIKCAISHLKGPGTVQVLKKSIAWRKAN